MLHDNCYTPLCTRRLTCTLWVNAMEQINAGATQLTITNPNIIDQAGGYDHCPLYHEHKLRRFARGLVWIYSRMTIDQLEQIQSALVEAFGYSTIKRIRHGYEAISPDEQATIANIFQTIAPGHEPQYKTFEEHYTKPPRVEGKAAHKLLK